MVTVDLEDEDDWGDVNGFWTGTEMAWGQGNDVDGYWKIERVFELMESHVELYESKFPVAYELTMAELRKLMEARVASWCGIALVKDGEIAAHGRGDFCYTMCVRLKG